MLAFGGPEINPPAPSEQGPVLAVTHVFLDARGPEINPPAPSEQGPGVRAEGPPDNENPRPTP